MRKSVVTPLTLGFLIMSALMGLMLFVSLFYATRLRIRYQFLTRDYSLRLVPAVHLQASLLAQRWAADRYLVSGDPSDREEAEAALALADR